MKNKYHQLIHPNSEFHILIVGAGGIGCELIKNLYKTDYKITLMDYDTVSQTNLNRQFCYRYSDINKSKPSTLKEYFKKLNPKMKLNIISGKLQNYKVDFFSQFDIMVSALDNNEGRKYLNEMAFKNGKEMVDAGTAGYNGQVQSYIRGLTECRYCKAEISEQNSFAVCTVRNKPERNIHCVHFGLNFYNNWSQKKEGELSLHKYLNGNCSFEEIREDCIKIHDYLFDEGIPQQMADINRLKYQKTGINVDEVLEKVFYADQLCQTIWSIPHYSQIFVESLAHSIFNQQVSYQKDNHHHILLLTSMINLRIHNFQKTNNRLRLMTYYECKDACGKIQPAIASTNAKAAALQIFQMMEILQKKEENVKYLSIHGFSETKIEGIQSRKSALDCMLCSKSNVYMQVMCNFEKYSLREVELYLSNEVDRSLLERDIRSDGYILVKKERGGQNYDKKIIELKRMMVQCQNRKEVRIRYLNRKKKNEYGNYEITLLHHEDSKMVIRNFDKERSRHKIQEYEKEYHYKIEKEKEWEQIESKMMDTSSGTKPIYILEEQSTQI